MMEELMRQLEEQTREPGKAREQAKEWWESLSLEEQLDYIEQSRYKEYIEKCLTEKQRR